MTTQKEVPAWVGKAQRWLDENAARIWAAWCKTKNGLQWKANQNRRRWHRNVQHLYPVAPNSPYAFGFSLPQYHHDLIEAVGAGDEETAKSIMLYEGQN